MPHTIEPATSGRAKCRGCGNAIAKGALRFGERLPNPFSEGKLMTHWFHPRCAALKRPEVFGETLEEHAMEGGAADGADNSDSLGSDEQTVLRKFVADGLLHRRLPRITGAGRAPSARARCRNCRETIDRDTWRIQLVYYEEGQFNPSGYIHLACAKEYFGTTDIVDRLQHFAPELTSEDVEEIRSELT